ncbi:hypothetical protein [Rubritalea tangerina]|uniref:hypothetical protein n=1 Tax=Rubritalea tangerina TaxID=430798 RepID=UPI00361A8D0C
MSLCVFLGFHASPLSREKSPRWKSSIHHYYTTSGFAVYLIEVVPRSNHSQSTPNIIITRFRMKPIPPSTPLKNNLTGSSVTPITPSKKASNKRNDVHHYGIT